MTAGDFVEKLIAEKHELLYKIEHEHNRVQAEEYRSRVKEIDAQLHSLIEKQPVHG